MRSVAWIPPWPHITKAAFFDWELVDTDQRQQAHSSLGRLACFSASLRGLIPSNNLEAFRIHWQGAAAKRYASQLPTGYETFQGSPLSLDGACLVQSNRTTPGLRYLSIIAASHDGLDRYQLHYTIGAIAATLRLKGG